jgi:hypothetical protein
MCYADIRSYMNGMMEQLISSPSVVPNCDQALSADMLLRARLSTEGVKAPYTGSVATRHSRTIKASSRDVQKIKSNYFLFPNTVARRPSEAIVRRPSSLRPYVTQISLMNMSARVFCS